MSNKLGRPLLSLLGLLVLYGIAFSLDRWMEYARQINTRYFNPFIPLWSWLFSNIILALCIFSFYRWALPNSGRRAIWFIIILGLLIDFVPVLFFFPSFQPLFSIRFISLSLPFIIVDGSYFILAGALTAMAGIFTLFRTR